MRAKARSRLGEKGIARGKVPKNARAGKQFKEDKQKCLRASLSAGVSQLGYERNVSCASRRLPIQAQNVSFEYICLFFYPATIDSCPFTVVLNGFLFVPKAESRFQKFAFRIGKNRQNTHTHKQNKTIRRCVFKTAAACSSVESANFGQKCVNSQVQKLQSAQTKAAAQERRSASFDHFRFVAHIESVWVRFAFLLSLVGVIAKRDILTTVLVEHATSTVLGRNDMKETFFVFATAETGGTTQQRAERKTS